LSKRSRSRAVREGTYFSLIVIPDWNWLVAQKIETDIPEIVRIDLRTNKETKVRTDDFNYLITVVPASGKILFSRPRGDEEEHVLWDPASGEMEIVKGEFKPLEDQTVRKLQSVAGSSEYWAAIPDEENNRTTIGRYDAQKFVFKPIFVLPEISFGSMNMWVDEGAKRIYIVYEGHLLRVPLQLKKSM
jgi:hypothetical protein